MVEPCIPAAWEGATVRWRHGSTNYTITIANPDRRNRGVTSVTLDGAAVDPRRIPLVDDGANHDVRVTLGEAASSRRESAPAPAASQAGR